MRRLPCRGVALLWVLAFAGACSVDETGLQTSAKLSRDGGLTGTGNSSPATGGSTGGATASGGAGGDRSGTGGQPLGTGGDPVGTGGSSTGGTDGATGGIGGAVEETGGVTGAGGTSDGGTAGQNGAGAAGNGTGGAGGMAGSGGAAGSGTVGTGGTAGGGHGGRCGPSNCMGCCDGNVCVTPAGAQQCGTHGAACSACAACQLCSSAGACAIDPTSQWTMVAAGAQVAMSPPIGATWDPPRGDEGGPAPDLFCEYENPSGDVTPTTAGVTTTLEDVYTAAWNQTITPSGVTVSASALMAPKPAWRIWVGDEDCSRANVCTSGQIVCSYQQPFTAAQLMSGAASIKNLQSCKSLDLKLVCASGQ